MGIVLLIWIYCDRRLESGGDIDSNNENVEWQETAHAPCIGKRLAFLEQHFHAFVVKDEDKGIYSILYVCRMQNDVYCRSSARFRGHRAVGGDIYI